MNEKECKIILETIDRSKKTLKSRVKKGYCTKLQERRIAVLEAMLNDTKIDPQKEFYIKHNCRREEGPEFTNPDGTEYFQPESIKACRVHEGFDIVNGAAVPFVPLFTEKDLDTYKVSNMLDMSKLLKDLDVSQADIAAKWTQKVPRDYHKMLEGKGTDELINMIASLDRATYYLGSYKQGDKSSELFFLKIDHHNIKEENKRLKNEIDLLKQSSNPEMNFYQDKVKELEYKLKIYESEKDDDINTLSLRLAAAQSEIEHLKGQLNSSECSNRINNPTVVVSKEKVIPEIDELYNRNESILDRWQECIKENNHLKELLKIVDSVKNELYFMATDDGDFIDHRFVLKMIRPLFTLKFDRS